MTGWRTARRIGTHTLGIACVAAVALLAQGIPGGETGAVRTREVPVAAGSTTLVCPSPAELVQDDVGDDHFDASPVETESGLTVAAGVPDVVGLDGEELTGDTAARVVRAAADTAAAATATSVTTAGDLRGLVAGACRAPAIDHWLVGGSTDVGSSSRLVLQNPGRTAASVSLEVWGPSGPVTLGGQALVVVPAGEQVSTTLEAVAPEQTRLVVHAASRGARVTAYVQHHRIDGLVPQGADLVADGALPSRALAVAGVDSRGESVEDPHAPSLRLLAPGDQDGTARLSIYGADGRVWLRGVDGVELRAGAVTDVPLGGLPAGRYAVVVDATVPVVGGGLVHRQGKAPEDSVVEGDPYDTAWIAGQSVGAVDADGEGGGGAAFSDDGTVQEAGDDVAPPPSPSLLALPDGMSWAVDVTAIPAARGEDDDPAGAADVTITGYAADGTETGTLDVTVPGGTDVDLSRKDLEPLGENVTAIGVTATGDAATVWGLLLADGSLVATLTPPATAVTESTVAVRDVVAD
ncbi:DUF5719 family protein [Myceligenerans indicum]|uniref:Secreted protein n=1 Tax=Myceligenerans indicum TaxID=2593663 RepID=A0ABS1LJY3_9MICO|nr:DUF5719 family protein [Myceligenerans indicum]MBL0885887.1 hypothetical protein [Myceligenerans indicum]